MNLCKRAAVVTALISILAAPLRAAPEAEAAAARELVKRYADAVVGVELVVMLKIKMNGVEQAPREQRVEVNGTVISPSGLTVTTLAEVDPQATFDALRASAGGVRGLEFVGSEFKEVKLRLADGGEVPARFVMKDADLDLAFMAPETTEAGKEFAHVKLDQNAEGRLMESFYLVGRGPKVMQRVALIRRSEVMGIVEKPRKLYVVTDQMPGTPLFNESGRILGVAFSHFANGRRTGLVILPAADIAEIAKQAEAAQAKPATTGQP